MASFRKVGGKVLAEVRILGRYKAKVHATKNEAKAWALETEHELRQSKGILQGKSLMQAMERYAIEETPKKKGARWEQIRIKRLSRDPIASLQLGDLAIEDFQDFITRLGKEGLKGSSINRYLSIFSAVLSKCRAPWKWLGGNPLEGVEFPKESPHRTKIINADEIKIILCALGYEEKKSPVTIRQRIAVAFLFALETGMRYGEIWNMKWEHVHLDNRYVHLPDTKNGDPRNVDLSKRAEQLLRKLTVKESGPVIDTNPRSSEVIFRKCTESSGYKGQLTFHDTRHTATTRLAGKLHVLDLAKMIGHKNPKQLMTYFNPTPGSMAHKLD